MAQASAEGPARALPSAFAFRKWGPFVGYLLLQAFVVAGLPTPRFPDSANYLGLSFTGANGRLFTVPLFYALLPADPLRICTQVLLAAVAWWVLASTVAAGVSDRRVSIGVRLVLLALGICGPIASWNSTILSESAAISLTALVVSAWLAYVRAPTRNRLLALLGVTILWMFVRPDNLLIGTLVVIAWVAWMVLRRRGGIQLVLAGIMVLICAGGLVASNLTLDTRVGLGDVLAQRILPNRTYTAWFVNHGMPYSTAIANYVYVYPAIALLHDPELGPWIDSQGEGVYAQFLVTHPVPDLLGWLANLSGEKASLDVPPPPADLPQVNPTPSLLSPTANYGRHREVLPEVLQDLLFQQGQIGDVLLLAAGAIALSIVARQRSGEHDRRLIVPTAVAVLAIVQTAIIYVSAGTELDRLGMVPAVEMRIALWSIAAFSLDRVLLQPTASGPRHRRLDSLE